ncbi:MAG: PD-(D/E)XK nuclease family protein [Chloroflexi bacterium]|nr:PD-(D/E)XK nuclease family protein [Chloroflexota bacterium]
MSGGTPPGGALQRVWAFVQAARGAVTAAHIARHTGLDPDLTAAALDWLVRRGYLQRWDDGRVCPTAPGTACRLCALRAWCPKGADLEAEPPERERG